MIEVKVPLQQRRRYTISPACVLMLLLILIAALPLWRVNNARCNVGAGKVARNTRKRGGDVYYVDYEFDQAYQYKKNARHLGPRHFCAVRSVMSTSRRWPRFSSASIQLTTNSP